MDERYTRRPVAGWYMIAAIASLLFMRVSIPGAPLGIFEKSPSPSVFCSFMKRFLEQMVARDAEWMHNNPALSDCDRMNADSHLRALLLGHNLTLQVSGGEVVLGQWQRILMAELDGPRARSLRIQIFGIS